MARRFAKVLEEEIEEAFFFYLSDLVNTYTTIPLRVGEERWIYTSPSGDSCIIFTSKQRTVHETLKNRSFFKLIVTNKKVFGYFFNLGGT